MSAADANLDLAVNAIVSSKVIFSGQVCNCAERVYVEDSIYDEFMDKVAKKMSQAKVDGAFYPYNPDMSSMVSKTKCKKLQKWLGLIKKKAQKLF